MAISSPQTCTPRSASPGKRMVQIWEYILVEKTQSLRFLEFWSLAIVLKLASVSHSTLLWRRFRKYFFDFHSSVLVSASCNQHIFVNIYLQGIDTGTDEWESKEYFMKRLLSMLEWLTEADLDTIAKDQNLRKLNDYVFSTKMYNQICSILFPHNVPFKQRRWTSFDKILDKNGFDEKVFQEKQRIFFPLAINLFNGTRRNPKHWVLVEVSNLLRLSLSTG